MPKFKSSCLDHAMWAVSMLVSTTPWQMQCSNESLTSKARAQWSGGCRLWGMTLVNFLLASLSILSGAKRASSSISRSNWPLVNSQGSVLPFLHVLGAKPSQFKGPNGIWPWIIWPCKIWTQQENWKMTLKQANEKCKRLVTTISTVKHTRLAKTATAKWCVKLRCHTQLCV